MFEEVTDLNFLVTVFLIVVPAYVANGFALLFGGGRPLDFGKKLFDGKRILGDGKTVRGTIAGIGFGTFGMVLELLVLNIILPNYNLNLLYIFLGFLVASGAVVGDIFGSFIKRRLGLPRGAPTPLLDQLDFILVAFLFAYLFNNFIIPLPSFSLTVFFVVVVVTPAAHFIACCIAYKAGWKREPW